MVEVKVSDLLGISLVMGIMVATMGSFVAFFSTGMEGDPLEALRIGGYVGAAACGITLLYGGWRLFEIKSGRGNKKEVDVTAQMRDVLVPVEAHAAGLSWASERPWRCSTHVRKEQGTLTVDLHDLDLAGARRVLDLIIENRPKWGRLRIITGRGNRSSGSRPVIRPMVSERLDTVATALDWQKLSKAGSITLRPMGKRPTFGRWLVRFVVFVLPITISMSLSFEELAGSGAREQGRNFGIAAGLILTGLLASYRER